jgi:hypothetical protein
MVCYGKFRFNNFLYIGAGNEEDGYSVWKTAATGSPPYNFTPIVTNGTGRGRAVLSVVSMDPFKGQLYVGSNGWPSSGLFPEQLPPSVVEENHFETDEAPSGA